RDCLWRQSGRIRSATEKGMPLWSSSSYPQNERKSTSPQKAGLKRFRISIGLWSQRFMQGLQEGLLSVQESEDANKPADSAGYFQGYGNPPARTSGWFLVPGFEGVRFPFRPRDKVSFPPGGTRRCRYPH